MKKTNSKCEISWSSYNVEIEAKLADHCLLSKSMYFGLRIDDLNRLAFEIAEANNIIKNFNK